MKHGTASAYNHGCHCSQCREANRARCMDLRARLRQRAENKDPAVPHGTPGGYKNWGCHCPQCTAANTEASRQYYSSRRGEQAAAAPEAGLNWLGRGEPAWPAAGPFQALTG